MLARFKIAHDHVEVNYRCNDPEDWEERYRTDFERDEYGDRIVELRDVEEVRKVRELGKNGENWIFQHHLEGY